MAKVKRIPPPMSSAFMSAIQRKINQLAAVQYQMAKQRFDANDLAMLFVPADLRKVLQEAFRLAAPRGVVYELYWSTPMPEDRGVPESNFMIKFNWERQLSDGFFAPHNFGGTWSEPATGVQEDCPPELRERWEQTVQDMIDISYKLGMVRYALTTLNDPQYCKTLPGMRYYLPFLVPLIEHIGYKDIADELRVPNPRAAGAVVIPPQVSQFLQPANATVASALMLSEAQPPANNGPLPVAYTICKASYHGGLFEGLT